MRGVFRGGVRTAAALTIALLLTSTAAAEPRSAGGRDRTLIDRLATAKRFVISILHRIGGPPGDVEPAPSGGGS